MKENFYLLGMAKSSLKFKTSGPRRNLELDVLRLIHFINLFQNSEIKVYGFMMVYNKEIKNLIIDKWLPKYNFKNPNFEVLTFENEKKFLDNKFEIFNEKIQNSNFKNSNAEKSKDLIEEILKNKLELKFGIENLKDIIINDFNGIEWDFQKKFTND